MKALRGTMDMWRQWPIPDMLPLAEKALR
jgi:hypothetical protein